MRGEYSNQQRWSISLQPAEYSNQQKKIQKNKAIFCPLISIFKNPTHPLNVKHLPKNEQPTESGPVVRLPLALRPQGRTEAPPMGNEEWQCRRDSCQ